MRKLLPQFIKKILKKIQKKILLEINIVLGFVVSIFGFDITPSFERKRISEIKYFKNKLSYRYIPKLDDRFNSITIDTSYTRTDLCELGRKYPTDKSPYNETDLSNHCFSGIYNLLFSNIRYNDLLIAEIGILFNQSIKGWRDFFKNSTIYGLEYNKDRLASARNDNLENVYYESIDVRDKKNMELCFETITQKHNKKFDIILDDSIHDNVGIDINILKIETLYKFLKPGGMLIIEDIQDDIKQNELDYFTHLKKFEKYFSEITFINCKHFNLYSPEWDNSKLLICVRNDFI